MFSSTKERRMKSSKQEHFAFLFDLDGTLVRTDDAYKKVWSELLESYNVGLTEDIYARYIQGNNDHIALANIFSKKLPCDVSSISARKDELFLKHIALIEEVPNAVSFLTEIKKEGHKVAIVSNSNRKVAEEIIRTLGLTALIDHLVIGNECEKPKPSPHPFAEAIQFFRIPNSRVIIFEDSTAGILSAKGNYPRCVVGVYSNDPSIVEKHQTDFRIQDYSSITLAELLNYQKGMTTAENVLALLERNKKALPMAQRFQLGGNKLKGGFIADVLLVDMIYRKDEVIPCVLKLKSESNTNMTRVANQLDLYEREFYFYQCINPYINVSTPQCFGIIKDDMLRSKGILLENLYEQGMSINLDLNTESIDVSLRILKRMAELHAGFSIPTLQEVFPLLKKHNDPTFNPVWANYIQSHWESFQQRWEFMMTPEQLALMKVIADKFQSIQDYLSQGMLTLCHGDIKSANIFYKKEKDGSYEPYFIDWQYIAYGKGVQDLAFFMIESFEKEVMVGYNEIFKRYYYHHLTSEGKKKGFEYPYNEFEKDFMVATCYFPFFVAIWFGTTSKNELIDINFPFFFIQKYLTFLTANVSIDLISSLP